MGTMKTIFWVVIIVVAVLYILHTPFHNEVNQFGEAVIRKLHRWEGQ